MSTSLSRRDSVEYRENDALLTTGSGNLSSLPIRNPFRWLSVQTSSLAIQGGTDWLSVFFGDSRRTIEVGIAWREQSTDKPGNLLSLSICSTAIRPTNIDSVQRSVSPSSLH
jgi:hypothetical protein